MEWAKAMTQAEQREEDVMLLNKEMHCVLKFCKWKADWWMKQMPLYKDLDIPLTEGLHAYASEQAQMEHQFHSAWSTKWVCAQALAQPILVSVMGLASVTMQGIKARPI